MTCFLNCFNFSLFALILCLFYVQIDGVTVEFNQDDFENNIQHIAKMYL